MRRTDLDDSRAGRARRRIAPSFFDLPPHVLAARRRCSRDFMK